MAVQDGGGRTIVHLMRHGEVHNPTGVLYGRLPEYFLSELGHEMAQAAAQALDGRDVTHLVASPLERAQQTAGPTAASFDLPIVTDERVIEAGNSFEGSKFGVGSGSLRHPSVWWRLRNPLRPSWGEPYSHIAARMRAAISDAREAARGHEAVIVSHQLPVWIARRSFENKSFVHDPRRRQCTLASLTTLTFEGDEFVSLEYSEPAAHLLPEALRRKFVGGA
jgi:broad specificity phosphatase PhoE